MELVSLQRWQCTRRLPICLTAPVQSSCFQATGGALNFPLGPEVGLDAPFEGGTEGTATDMSWRIAVRSRAQCSQLPSYPHTLKKHPVEGAQASGALD